MQINLDSKDAVVTGATAGIGYAIARGLAPAGANVVVNGRSRTRADEAVARLTGELQASMLQTVEEIANMVCSSLRKKPGQ